MLYDCMVKDSDIFIIGVCKSVGSNHAQAAFYQLYFLSALVFSRAHTIVGVVFTQKRKNEAGEETAKTSLINLVDLAGR